MDQKKADKLAEEYQNDIDFLLRKFNIKEEDRFKLIRLMMLYTSDLIIKIKKVQDEE